VLVALSLLGIVLYAAIDLLERLALPWHVSHRMTDGAKPTEPSP
jgi:NitT/TauT family transport system permease protein